MISRGPGDEDLDDDESDDEEEDDFPAWTDDNVEGYEFSRRASLAAIMSERVDR